MGVFDKRTGEPGLILSVTSIHWKSDSEVLVEGGYDQAEMSSSENAYTLRKQGAE
jgi:hypothetical protein